MRVNQYAIEKRRLTWHMERLQTKQELLEERNRLLKRLEQLNVNSDGRIRVESRLKEVDKQLKHK